MAAVCSVSALQVIVFLSLEMCIQHIDTTLNKAQDCTANCSSNKDCYRTLQKLSNSATEKEATIEAKCSAVCVDKLFLYCPSCQLEPSIQGQWSSLNFFQLKDNCTVYQKFKDCHRGCVAYSKNISSTVFQCKDQCLSQCPSTTKYDLLPESCTVKCTSFACQSGCQIYSEIIRNDSILLSSQLKEPLIKSAINTNYYLEGGQCLYSVAVDVSPPVVSSGAGEDVMTQSPMTTFVFKIYKGNDTYYIPMVSSSGILDLGFLTCERVNISYKAVTLRGESSYSKSVQITLDGAESALGYPAQVQSMDAYIVEDFREGYSGHAITTLSWSKPNNTEFLTHYRLIVFSHLKHCGGVNVRYEYCIDKDATNFTVISETPDRPLFLGCRYSTRLISEPNSETHFTTISVNTESVSDTRPPISVYCTRQFQPNGKQTVYAIWDGQYERGLFEALDKYTVSLQLFDFSTRSIVPDYPLVTTHVYPNINESINVYTATDLPVLENIDRKFMIRVDARSNHKFPWRHMPRYGKCISDSFPEPPSLVNSSSIIVNNLSFTDTQFYINLTWSPPMVANGNITRYELRIGRDPFSELDDQNDFSFIHTVEHSQSTVVSTSEIYQLGQVACLNLQIRCMNNYLWSNWSDPILLHKYPNNPSCDNIILGTPVINAQRSIVSTIVGAVLGGLGMLILLILMLAGAIVLCRRYRRRNRYLEAFKDPNSDSLYIKSPMSPGIFTAKPMDSPKLDEWEIPAGLVVIEKRLGEGCFGEVYQGVVKGPINNSKVQASLKNVICPVVAIKLLKSTATGSEKMDFLQEIDTMKTVSKGNNPHVVNLVGCVTIQEPLCLITEFVKHGDLLSYLQSIRKMVTQRQLLEEASLPTVNTHNYTPYMMPSLNTDGSPSKRASIAIPNPESPYAELGEIDSVNLLSFAYQIASGMEFLASLGIVHRDLACRNILVDDGKSLKISDFGMSRMVAADDVYVKNTRGRLPWKWMAIESILNREFTSASDVWSYGVTLWEIATLGGFPYPTVTNAELLDHLQKGLRLEKPENCSQDVYNIMQECWLTDPHSRLTFTALRAKFDSLISAQQGHTPYIDLDIDYCKPYYTSLVEDSDEDKEGSPTTSEGDAPLEGRYDTICPMLENPEALSRPIENPYVDTPTSKMTACEIRFDLSTSIGDPCPSEIPESPLKKKLTEVV